MSYLSNRWGIECQTCQIGTESAVSMPDKLQTFLVNVFIIEGRHYSWPNMNSVVLVTIDNRKKYTSVKNNTDSPYYNDYFVFEFCTTMDALMDKHIEITVFKPGSAFRKRKTLGSISLEVAMVWHQSDHQIYHKWAVLVAPSKDFAGTRGYLKLDISILSKGQTPVIPQIGDSDEIEGNLFLPQGCALERQRVNLIFDVYRGLDFVKKVPMQESGKKLEPPASVGVRVSFCQGMAGTTFKKNTSQPQWNERLVIPALFPPLCQRLKVELLYGEAKKAVRYLYLKDIASAKEKGFLPTFGPGFLHFYSENPLEGYLGKILLALHTDLLDSISDVETKSQVLESATPIDDPGIKNEEIVVFAAVFEASSIWRSIGEKAISFRLTCGLIPTDFDSGDFCVPVTPPIKPIATNRNYLYLPIEDLKPCLFLNLNLPDLRKKMYLHNLLKSLLHHLKACLGTIEMLLAQRKPRGDVLSTTFDLLKSTIEKYQAIVSGYNFIDDWNLDQKRHTLVLKELDAVMVTLTGIVQLQEKKLLQKLDKIYTNLEELMTELETWPKIFLWMMSGSKRVAYYVATPEDLVFSLVAEESGPKCGVLETLHLQAEKTEDGDAFLGSVCKLEAMFWMGLARHWGKLAASLAPSFDVPLDTIPRGLNAKEKHEFHCCVYIFQGRLSPGSDTSGLCDPYAEVFLNGQSQKTQILKKTLNPIWDQALVFMGVMLYGSEEFILENPPCAIVEIYDIDACGKSEAVGKTMIRASFRGTRNAAQLSWYPLQNRFGVEADILAAAELVLGVPPKETITQLSLPEEIRPKLINHRIDVMFWGVRNLKKHQLSGINKPKIVIYCGNNALSSDILPNAKKNLNFLNPIKSFESVFAEIEEYARPLRLKMFDSRTFGINVFVGVNVVQMQKFFYHPITWDERKSAIENNFEEESLESLVTRYYEIEAPKEVPKKKTWKKLFHSLTCRRCFKDSSLDIGSSQEATDDEDLDWWSKFYASLEEKRVPTGRYLKIYACELENQPEFGGFQDLLRDFPMYKGKRSGDKSVDDDNTTGVFKGSMRIYPYPLDKAYVTPSGQPLKHGFFQDFPLNTPMRYILRVYCVRGLNLRPKDLSGKSDPYIKITLEKQVINDKDNCVLGQINPVFGRCFELEGIFPRDHTVTIAVWDWDATTSDDLIGETKISLENRFYTKHRANCGIAFHYDLSGYAQWRDYEKPSQILANLCKKWKLPPPEYNDFTVTVANRQFLPDTTVTDKDIFVDQEHLALSVLKHWPKLPIVGFDLVPEHVETRSLYNPEKPGIEQGKLQCWLDILPLGELPTPPQVNITPRQPVSYELRVIVWNADRIPLQEDDFLTGEKKSDVFIKSWLTFPETAQYTDVHYRSLYGEANFNWRLIFVFEYLSSENKLVFKKKTMWGETEEKMPCQLHVQVWDNDTFSTDDFLGTQTLELSKLPRGFHTAKSCNLPQFQNAPTLNLFKTRRTKGWYPFKNSGDDREVFAGAVELELELLTKEEADKRPAGVARDQPQALPKPNRPDTSFSSFKNPWKGFKYVLKLHRWKFIKALLVLILFVVLVKVLYVVPDNVVKKVFSPFSKQR